MYYKSVLITGANRGIGLGLVKEFLAREQPPAYLLAIVRDLSRADELQMLAKQSPQLHLIQCDVSKFEQHSKLLQDVQDILPGERLSILINNAGVCPSSKSLLLTPMEEVDECFHVNFKTPMALCQLLLPLLKSRSDSDDGYAWIVNVSSTLASISANCTAGFYPYRASKAALNAFTKNLSIEFKHDQVLAMVIHPGWVQTDMGGSTADITVEESCRGMMQVLTSLKPNQNGKFYQFNGQELPW